MGSGETVAKGDLQEVVTKSIALNGRCGDKDHGVVLDDTCGRGIAGYLFLSAPAVSAVP
jgi:hypothetical protein